MTIRFTEFSNKIQNSKQKARALKVEESIVPSSSREEFFSSDKFSKGKTVSSAGKLWEVVDKRCNYVVLIDESGKMVKKFPRDIKETEEVLEFPPGTFKGIPIPSKMKKVVENIKEEDPFAIIKAIGAYNSGNYVIAENICSTLGADVSELKESTKQEQYQAALIVASAIGCKSTAKDAQSLMKDIKDHASKSNMSSSQKKIYTDMLEMLKKLGLSSDVNEEIETSTVVTPEKKANFQQLKAKLGVDVKKTDIHTAPGHSLGASNETHRKQSVRKLMGLD